MPTVFRALLLAFAAAVCAPAAAQFKEESYLRLSTHVALDAEQSDFGTDLHIQFDMPNYRLWIDDMSQRLVRILPQNSVLRNQRMREDFLATVYYESARAGLNPQWVLALIQVESAFRKYAISPVGARGYMQVMPFWVKLIGDRQDNLFHLRTNLRYGTVILRHYLNIEQGNLYRALGRYNGSLGKPKYPYQVFNALQSNWLVS